MPAALPVFAFVDPRGYK
jgi:hypothetical protein